MFSFNNFNSRLPASCAVGFVSASIRDTWINWWQLLLKVHSWWAKRLDVGMYIGEIQ